MSSKKVSSKRVSRSKYDDLPLNELHNFNNSKNSSKSRAGNQPYEFDKYNNSKNSAKRQAGNQPNKSKILNR